MKAAPASAPSLGNRTITSSKRSETNFASQVAAIRAAKADFIILSHQPDDGGKMLLQIRERGVNSQIVDTGGTVGGRDF